MRLFFIFLSLFISTHLFAQQKRALIFGITGQDGAYLARFLLDKGYVVHGVKRRSSSYNTSRIDAIYEDPHIEGRHLILHYGDLTDSNNLINLIRKARPDEIYNLAAQSHVRVSFDMPLYTADVDGMGTLRILDAIEILGLTDKVKFYQASTSELFGKVQETPQKETTPFYPRSPYAVAKQFGYWSVVNHREAYNMFACNGILFNHESPLRGETFVTRKVTMAATKIAAQKQKCLYLGNLDAKRDWGYAKDYIEAMWLMLQQEEPDDYVIATGEMHTVRELVELAFEEVGIPLQWKGEGVDEVGIDKNNGQIVVRIDPQYFRPTEVDLLLGDPTKANVKLGWKPKTSFKELIRMMVHADQKALLLVNSD